MKAAVFDFDGTLMDSMGAWAGKMLHVLDTHGIAYPPDIIRTITPLGDRGSADYFIRQLGLRLTVPEILAELDAYALPEYTLRIQPKTGVPAYLAQLKKRGVRLGVLTASPQKMIRPCLARTGLASYFEFAYSCDDLQMSKSETAIYDETARRMGLANGEITFFDDNLLAVSTAAKAGLATVGVFDESSAGDEAAIRGVCGRYIRSFTELLEPAPEI